MKKIFFFITFFASLTLGAQDINIIPQPQQLKVLDGNFILSKQTTIVSLNKTDDKSIRFLNDYLQKFYGFKLKIAKQGKTNCISFVHDKNPNKNIAAYQLNITPNCIKIVGEKEGGFYAVQTIIQLLPILDKQPVKILSFHIPCVQIIDEPRFSYRGMHLDVGLHFFSVDYIKKYIDFIALHKMNVFHWHLTEDQGWRIEIKKYPKLTQIGAYRNGTIIGKYPGTGNTNQKYGGYYTQKEVKEIVQYAADRYITIIPEIELPGHSSAAIAAYPELSCFPNESTFHSKKTPWAGDSTGKQVQQTWGVFDDVFIPSDKTFKFLEDVLDEVLALFPSKLIHIGGDECPKENWKRSLFCQQLIKEKGLKDELGLQSYFIQRIEKYLNSKGRQIIGWDEILEGGLAPNATVMSWRGEAGGIAAAQQHHPVIMTPKYWCYFDYSQTKKEDSITISGYTTIEKTYSYEPISKELTPEQATLIMGGEACVWTEYIDNPGKLEYMIFPRMAALSEVLWSSKDKKNWQDFSKRLPAQLSRYSLWEAKYSKAFYENNPM